jgi:ComF family protein
LGGLKRATRHASSRVFNLIFPDNCRICDEPLSGISRIPVCPACLELPEPLAAESFCPRCRTPFLNEYALNEHGLCETCREGLANFDAAYAFGSYEGGLRDLVRLLKYSKVTTLAQPLGRYLLRALPLNERFDLVMAMPMHWRKRWVRGFNQAELLARPVARRMGLKLAGNLRRRRYTPSQASLDETERRKSPHGSFSVRRAQQVKGKRVLLIDDVFTTGSTLRAAAEALKAAGAVHVSVLALARADRRFRPAEERAGMAMGVFV